MRTDTRNVRFVEAAPFLGLMGQREAAAAAGVHKRTVWVWKRHNEIPRDAAERIALAAGVDPNDLYPSWSAGANDLPDRRLPLAPLLEAFDGTAYGLAKALNMVDECDGWEAEGVPLDVADKAANMLRLHPMSIWPEWVDDLMEAS